MRSESAEFPLLDCLVAGWTPCRAQERLAGNVNRPCKRPIDFSITSAAVAATSGGRSSSLSDEVLTHQARRNDSNRRDDE